VRLEFTDLDTTVGFVRVVVSRARPFPVTHGFGLAPGDSSVITAQSPVITSNLFVFPINNSYGAKAHGRAQVLSDDNARLVELTGDLPMAGAYAAAAGSPLRVEMQTSGANERGPCCRYTSPCSAL
jgi:hypothetical protein